MKELLLIDMIRMVVILKINCKKGTYIQFSRASINRILISLKKFLKHNTILRCTKLCIMVVTKNQMI